MTFESVDQLQYLWGHISITSQKFGGGWRGEAHLRGISLTVNVYGLAR